MSSPGDRAVPDSIEALRRIVAQIVQVPTAHPVVLIDGPSGSGKSTLADRIVAHWPGTSAPTLVRMDDIYPGWGGLDAAITLIRSELLEPRRHDLAARWRRYDWAAGIAAEWILVDAERPLIVEGCGTLSPENAALADLRIWVSAEDAIRKARALDRDNGGFDAHWDEWQESFDRYTGRERPLLQADLVFDASKWQY